MIYDADLKHLFYKQVDIQLEPIMLSMHSAFGERLDSLPYDVRWQLIFLSRVYLREGRL